MIDSISVRPKAASLAERRVDVRLYSIIYDALNDIRAAMEGLLEPTLKERVLGRVEVRQMFTIPKAGLVAGCYVVDGVISRASAGVRVIRDSVVVYEGKLGSLRRFRTMCVKCSRDMSAVSRSKTSMTSKPETSLKRLRSTRSRQSSNQSIVARRQTIGHDRRACTVELFIPMAHSLKDKRQVLQSLKSRLRDKFNVSVAEVGDQELWQKAILGLACVANESST